MNKDNQKAIKEEVTKAKRVLSKAESMCQDEIWALVGCTGQAGIDRERLQKVVRSIECARMCLEIAFG